MSIFQNVSQPARLVGIWFNRFFEPACGTLFFVILKPKTYMDRAHKLQIGLGQYFGSILGFGLGYL